MLNLGMTEIFCFAVIALLVLGPDKLPEAARFVAKWYGKIKKFINNIQNEIDRELRLSEFREEMQKEIDKITELERRMQQQLDALKSTPTPSDAEPVQAEANKPMVTYALRSQQAIIPFSLEYQKQLPFNLEPPNVMAQKFDTELKIAV
ncbi:twin arginine-targeting protein translocase TatB [Acinetobacter sp. ANC 3929]|uniref:Sec-independent protein translocase protein TatB n=1 Tax=unclassified Acinetobacter TaxID=196816 RepID=UPI0002CF33DC|nr:MULTISPECIES: Sec-independent protein translocase protein TatB [unclassified Acinetobacter]ENW83756.1 twin arginine-targeting protein translocase TatB [Acinetobacter sp. ANC 3929]MCH7353372.1 Sec-independent protein translocase protein TatB [Acinetobacter sp. NIPH 2023]MCH7357028.1 Sec-independent protein translocase protein TatB [Acinetobacter sp. NIPH 1958]MCH7360754.1 Sec-independent protein translocase protein TatB [Acinetobacter sp. NIPH 2024]